MKKLLTALTAVVLTVCMGGGSLLAISCSNSAGGSGGDDSVTYVGSKNPTEAKAVGDIVFNDGSAESYSENLNLSTAQQAAAVAVIFYTAPTANYDLGSKTLGVGLKHLVGKPWARYTSDSEKAIGYENKLDGTFGMPNALSETDGSSNTNAMKILTDWSSENYPAAYFAATYTVSGFTNGWYLPAWKELSALYEVKSVVDRSMDKLALNPNCNKLGAASGHWTSTQDPSTAINAKYVVSGGYLLSGDKNHSDAVRAIRAF